MTPVYIILGLLLWYGIGIWNQGYYFAWQQKEFPNIAADDYNDDRMFAIFWAIIGPIGFNGKKYREHGWMNPFKKEGN